MTTPTETAFLKELDKKLWIAADRLRSNLDAAVYMRAMHSTFSTMLTHRYKCL